MGWTIHSWSSAQGVGAIASDHFDAIPFDAAANVQRVTDFRVGESIQVEVDGIPPNCHVIAVRPMVQRQPPGTAWPAFDAVNGRWDNAMLEESTPGSLQIWLGDCCSHCTPNPARVRFDGVSCVHGADDDFCLDNPLFRLASQEEVRSRGLVVPEDSKVFCIVTSHGHGPDGPCIFVVACTVETSLPSTNEV